MKNKLITAVYTFCLKYILKYKSRGMKIILTIVFALAIGDIQILSVSA
jgi:hypothetical protein